jgi:hypothetical protein
MASVRSLTGTLRHRLFTRLLFGTTRLRTCLRMPSHAGLLVHREERISGHLIPIILLRAPFSEVLDKFIAAKIPSGELEIYTTESLHIACSSELSVKLALRRSV